MDTEHNDTPETSRRNPANVRTALALLSIALVFFFGIMATRLMGGVSGIAVMGTAVLLFLVVAIGRNLRVGTGGASRGRKGASPSDRGDGPRDALDPRQPEQGQRQ
jgi:hypothetical protein